MIIRNLDEVNKALAPYVSKSSRLLDKDLKLERVLHLLKALGNPHENLKIMHVAGTSGKTSTSYYMAALLQAAGKKVGLTVSPHVDGVNERVQINGKPLSEEKFCSELGNSSKWCTTSRSSESPSYFELLAALRVLGIRAAKALTMPSLKRAWAGCTMPPTSPAGATKFA